jgi:hypothetical protein
MYPFIVFTQSIERQVIGTTGGFSAAGQTNVSFTVGETVIATGIKPALILTQGYQQPDENVLGIEAAVESISIKAFPNPTPDIIIVEAAYTGETELVAQVCDVNGKRLAPVLNYSRTPGKTTIEANLKSLAPAVYFIRLTSGNGTFYKSIAIQKIN